MLHRILLLAATGTASALLATGLTPIDTGGLAADRAASPTTRNAQVAAANADAAAPEPAPAWTACTRKLDGVTTAMDATQHTVTIVNQTSRTHARVSFWVRLDGACSLDRLFLTKTARLGYGGTVTGTKRKQGSGTTPRGTYTMSEAFGNGKSPATVMPFHRVKKGDYWVGDNASKYYNSRRNKSQGGFRWKLSSSNRNSSEYLPHYTHQYRYAVVINFNRAPDYRKAYRGTGIFLHVKSSGATGGCVGVTAKQMRIVLAHLVPGDKITIAR
jgi:L,D-peptidoglycan transpeptidase YkuD (ErfK/YbiS/YcfS/YnhG family)